MFSSSLDTVDVNASTQQDNMHTTGRYSCDLSPLLLLPHQGLLMRSRLFSTSPPLSDVDKSDGIPTWTLFVIHHP
jgi:hypothetical protein